MDTLFSAIISVAFGMVGTYICASSTASAQNHWNDSYLEGRGSGLVAVLTGIIAVVLTFLGFDVIISTTMRYFHDTLHTPYQILASLLLTATCLLPYFRYILKTRADVLEEIERINREGCI